MGKRRNAAKTGDKKLYASRNALREPGDVKPQDIDSFHKGREESFLGLSTKNESSDEEEQFESKQNMLDLALAHDDSEEESDDDSSSKEAGPVSFRGSAPHPEDGSDDDRDDNYDDDDEPGELDARRWGRKKSAYYDGDLADLELGVQAEDDALVEEEAAREVQASRLDEMQEDDFVPPGHEDETEDFSSLGQERFATVRDTTQLSVKERRKLLKVQHPELLPVASYFSEILKEFLQTTKVATNALMGQNVNDQDTAKSIGASKQGQQLLLTKALAEQSAVLNMVLYLLLKSTISDEDDIEAAIGIHPVMLQLKRSNTIIETLSNTVVECVDGLESQIKNLVQAASFLAKSIAYDEDNDVVAGEEIVNHGSDVDNSADDQTSLETASLPESPIRDEQEHTSGQRVLEETRFGLRQHEVQLENKRKRRNALQFSEFSIETDEVRDTKGLASAINAIEQRATKRNMISHTAPLAGELEYCDDEVAAGLRIMDHELDHEGNGPEFADGLQYDLEDGPSAVDEFDSIDFYDKMAGEARKKKQRKKAIHMVAPKFPTFEGEVEGERAISRTILKNRGLVPHKNRINRNPRVKKRVQYQKAIIRRKGAVREIRTDEGRYEGEGTGIKSRISRSRKLIS